MPRLTPPAVNTVRGVVVWVLRAAAVVLLTAGWYLFLKKLLFAIGNAPSGFVNMFTVYEGIGEQQSTYRGLAMILIGATLALFATRIARWIVAMPETGCPRCGYSGAVNDTCPECGLAGVEGGRSGDEGTGPGSI